MCYSVNRGEEEGICGFFDVNEGPMFHRPHKRSLLRISLVSEGFVNRPLVDTSFHQM